MIKGAKIGIGIFGVLLVLVLFGTVIIAQNEEINPIELSRTQVEIGKPVKWTKTIKTDHLDSPNIRLQLSELAENINIRTAESNNILEDVKIKRSNPLKRLFTGFNKITGFAVSDGSNLEINEVEITTIAAEDIIVEYETAAPLVYETELGNQEKYVKKVVISSHIHYTDILSYTDIPETTEDNIKLYHKKGGLLFNQKVEVTENADYKVEYLDMNGNGFIDRIKWITPHLSEQEFEVEVDISILNVQSYPIVEGNWTVQFLTNGTADLSIEAVNDTSFGVYPDDIEFLELKCGDTVLTPSYDGITVSMPDYSCDDVSYFTVKVHTPGHHYQEYSFGGIIKHAQNLASTVGVNVKHGCSGEPVTEDNPVAVGEHIGFQITWTGDTTDHAPYIYPTGGSGSCDLTSQGSCWNYSATKVANGYCLTYVVPSGLNTDQGFYVKIYNDTGNEGQKTTIASEQTLYTNKAPIIDATITGEVVTEDLTLTITIDDDAGDFPYNISIDWYKDGIINNSLNITSQTIGPVTESLDSAYTRVGEEWYAEVTVKDKHGSSGSDTSQTITITSITLSMSPSSGAAFIGIPRDILTTGGESPYNYEYNCSSICTLSPLTSIDGNTTLSCTAPGTCKVNVTDNGGSFTQGFFSVQFEDFQIDPSEYTLERLESYIIDISGSSASTYRWDYNNSAGNREGLIGNETWDSLISAKSINLTGITTGNYTIFVNDSNSNYISARLTVVDTTPPREAIGIHADDNRKDQGGNITISWVPSPSEATDVSHYVVYRSDYSDGAGAVARSPELSIGNLSYVDMVNTTEESWSGNLVTYYYFVRTYDLQGLFNDSEIVSAVANAQPIMLDIDYFPKNPNSLDNITCYAWAEDRDEEDLTMFYRFTVTAFEPGGTDYVETGEASCINFPRNTTDQWGRTWENKTVECKATLSYSRTTLGDKFICSFYAYDGKEGSSNMSLPTGFIAINNTRPFASDVYLTPTSANESSTLTCNYDYYDPDNQAEGQSRFKWYINNEGLNDFVEVYGYTDKTISSIFDKDDIIKCAVQVRDTDPSWINNPLYDDIYVESDPIIIRDNAVPQIIDYSNSHNLHSYPALVGDQIEFNVSWVDYEDQEDSARIYVCEDLDEYVDYFDPDSSNVSASFGDYDDETTNALYIFTNKTGKYVNRIGIRPYKYLRNDKITYAPGSRVEDGDYDIGLSLKNFSTEAYYDADISETYTYGETIIREDPARGTPLVYDSEYDELILGVAPPEGTILTNFSKGNMHRYYDSNDDGFDVEDDIYFDRSGSGSVSIGDIRRTIVSESSLKTLSTPFIYDIIVREVDFIGDTTGPVIARDNDNSFTIGRYNYFTLQYNAQPLPNKYLAFEFCIDSNNDDICDSNGNYMNDTVYIKVSESQDGYLVMDNIQGSANFSYPDVTLFYGREGVGCAGKEYCSTDNSNDYFQSCLYTAVEGDLWNSSYKVKVCDEKDACSVSRYGSFYVNHPPTLTAVTINTTKNSSLVPEPANLTIETNKHILCSFDIDDPDEGQTLEGSKINWYVKKQGEDFTKAYLPESINYLTSGNTRPGEYWKCEVFPFDGYHNGSPRNSSAVFISGEDMKISWIKSIIDDSSAVNPTSPDDKVRFGIEWDSIIDTQVKIFICSSPNIVETGCWGDTYAQSDWTNEKFIELEYSPSDTIHGHKPYYVGLADQNWNLDIYDILDPLNFTINRRPVINWATLNTSTGNLTVNDNLHCSINWTDNDFDEQNIIITYLWYYNRSTSGYVFNIDNVPSNETLSHGNTLSGDQWRCSAIAYDGYSESEEVFSNVITIEGESEFPVAILNASSDSSEDSPTPVGDTIFFDVDWINIRNTHVKIYVCNSSNILNSGCSDSTIAQSGWTTDPSLRLSYTAQESDYTQNYWVRVCNDHNYGYECSDVYPSVASGITLNFSVNHRPNASDVHIRPTDDYSSMINCSFTFNDKDSHDEGSHEFIWHKDSGSGFFTLPDTSQMIEIDFSEGNSYKCEVKVKDEHGLSDIEFRGVEQEYILDEIPKQPIIYSQNDVLKGKYNLSIIGYYNKSPVQINAHARQNYSLKIADPILYDSQLTYHGSATLLDTSLNGSDYIIIRRSDHSKFTTARYISFSNHELPYFERYGILSKIDLLDNTYLVTLDRPLLRTVESEVVAHIYNDSLPLGWFNLTFEEIFEGENRIRIIGNNSYGYGSYLEIDIYADLTQPVINDSRIGQITTKLEPVIVFELSDDYALNLSSLYINLSNEDTLLNYSYDNIIYKNTNPIISCSDVNNKKYNCEVQLSLSDNSTYNLSIYVQDKAGYSSSILKEYKVNSSLQNLDFVLNGFISDNLYLPALIATTKKLAVNWTNVSEDLIDHYKYKLDEYDQQGISLERNIKDWTNVGKNTSINDTFELRNKYIYKFSVKIIYTDGSESPELQSTGIIYYVNTPPTVSNIRFVNDLDEEISYTNYTNSQDKLKIKWDAESEIEILSYKVIVGTAPYPEYGYNLFADTNTTLKYIDIDKILFDNDTIYANVRAMSSNGHWSDWKTEPNQGKIIVDQKPPEGGSISYETGSRATNITIYLDSGTDEGSGIGLKILYVASTSFVNGGCSDYNLYQPINFDTSSQRTDQYIYPLSHGFCYKFYYEVCDRANNCRSYPYGGTTYEVRSDLTPPEPFQVTFNKNNFLATSNEIQVTWTNSRDNESGISHYSYVLYEQTNNIWTAITNSTVVSNLQTQANIIIQNPKHQKEYKVVVTAYSTSFNSFNFHTTTSESNSIYYLDTTPPETVVLKSIEGYEVSEGEYYYDYNGDGHTILEFIGEQGIECVASQYKIDFMLYNENISYLSNCTSPHGSESNFTCNITTANDGHYKYYVVCKDTAGNQQFAEDAAFAEWFVDHQGPIITIRKPTERTYGSTVEIDFELEDPSGIKETWYEIRNDSLGRELLFEKYIDSNENKTFYVADEWDTREFYNEANGSAVLYIYSYDALGQLSQSNITFKIDNIGPIITFIKPSDDERYFNQDFNISARIEGNISYSNYSILKDDSIIQTDQRQFNPPEALIEWNKLFNLHGREEGKYILRVYGRDPNGRETESEITFYIDRTPPVYNSASTIPPEDIIYNDNSVILKIVWPSEFNTIENSCDLDKVYIEHNANGSFKNYTNIIKSGDDFSLIIPSSMLQNNQTVIWRSYAKDFAGNWNITEDFSFSVSNRRPYILKDIENQKWITTINNTPLNLTEYLSDKDKDILSYNLTYLLSGLRLYEGFDYSEDLFRVNFAYLHSDELSFTDGIIGSSVLIESSRQNLLHDPSFEENEWDIEGFPSRITSSYSGDYSAKVNKHNYYEQRVNYLVKGNTYTLSAYMRSEDSLAYGRLHINWYNQAHQLIDTTLMCGLGDECTSTPLLNQTWQRYQASTVAPQQAHYAKVIVDAHNSSYIYVDNIQLEENSYATSFMEDYRFDSGLSFDISYGSLQEGSLVFWLNPEWDGNADYDYNPLVSFYSEKYPDINYPLYHTGSSEEEMPGYLTFIDFKKHEFLRDNNTGIHYNNSDWIKDEWHMIALTWENDLMHMYVDNIYAGNDNIDFEYISHLSLGDLLCDDNLCYIRTDAAFDELALFDRRLNEDEIQMIYVNRSYEIDPQETRLYYSLDEDNITLYTDYNWSGEAVAFVTASDNWSFIRSNLFNIEVIVNNSGPSVALVPVQNIFEKQEWNYTINAIDEDENDILTYYVDKSEIEIDSSNGFMNWTPSYLDEGEYNVTVRVCDDKEVVNSCNTTIFLMIVNIYDMDNDQISDTIDTINGTVDMINTTFSHINFTIDNNNNVTRLINGPKTVRIKNASIPVAEFVYDFDSSNKLNLPELKIYYDESLIIKGINSSRIIGKKNIFIENRTGNNTICIKDTDDAGATILASCAADDEFFIECNGNLSYGQYRCKETQLNGKIYYNITGLNNSIVREQSNCTDYDKDGICFEEDFLIGSIEDINITNPEGYIIPNFSMTVSGDSDISKVFSGVHTIVFSTNNTPIVEFEFNFSNESRLYLSEISLGINNESNLPSYIYADGIPLGDDDTKTLYLKDLNSSIEFMCIRDASGSRLENVDFDCNNRSSEYLINGSKSISDYSSIYSGIDYNWTLSGGYYKVEGLHNSIIVQQDGCVDENGDGYGYGKNCLGVVRPSSSPGSSRPAGNNGGSSGGGGGGIIPKDEDILCNENWKCNEWSSCLSSGLQIRSCKDLNDCGTFVYKPFESKNCEDISAKESCYDGIQNQGEIGIDCGGPCDPCPTCFDNIKNQGEEGVDCGGPCKTCPSCIDGIQNQGEEGIDCGGPCKRCPIEESPDKSDSNIMKSIVKYFIIPIIFMIIIAALFIAFLYYRDPESFEDKSSFLRYKLTTKKEIDISQKKPDYYSKAERVETLILYEISKETPKEKIYLISDEKGISRKTVDVLFALDDYCGMMLQKGYKKEAIMQTLKSKGWPEDLVDLYFIFADLMQQALIVKNTIDVWKKQGYADDSIRARLMQENWAVQIIDMAFELYFESGTKKSSGNHLILMIMAELYKGTSPDVLKTSLRSRGINPSIVDMIQKLNLIIRDALQKGISKSTVMEQVEKAGYSRVLIEYTVRLIDIELSIYDLLQKKVPVIIIKQKLRSQGWPEILIDYIIKSVSNSKKWK